jgi:large subunit ribosomal protein L29
MNVNELRELTPAELDEKIYELKQNLFELRRKKAVGALEHGEEIRNVRKTLAKAETVKRQRALNIAK